MRGTLLMAAVATQQLELIELLLSAGASVHVTDAFGCTALSSASCPLDHQPNRAKLARGALPTASRQVRAPHPDPHPTPTRPQPDPNPTPRVRHSWAALTGTPGRRWCSGSYRNPHLTLP